jgi:NADH dehydrogenase FAD-containing subunit
LFLRQLQASTTHALPRWPQRRHLALISIGERYAVASRGGFKMEGAWLWWLKDWIDRRWLRQYHFRFSAVIPNAAKRRSGIQKHAEDH